MSFQSWSLELPSLPVVNPSQLKVMADQVGELEDPDALMPTSNSRLVSKPRKIGEIIADINQGKVDDIRLSEWLYCLYKKSSWDCEHPDQAITSAVSIWEMTEYVSWMRQRLYRHLILALDTEETGYLAPSMIEAFDLSFLPLDNEVLREVIQALRYADRASASINELATQCLQRQQLPNVLLEQAKLPKRLNFQRRILVQIPEAFILIPDANKKKTHVDLLLSCLETLSDDEQVQNVEALLCKVPKEVGGQFPKLVDWIKDNYGFYSQKHSLLSKPARDALKKWIGAVNYDDFRKLVDSVLSKVYLKDWQKRQLRSRREFWGNYSDRFERIRILLPQSTSEVLRADLGAKEYSIFTQSDPKVDTEVCIFDFGDWFIAEFFRGNDDHSRDNPYSEVEIRIYKNEYQVLEQELFQDPIASPNCLRCMGGEIHDHKDLWQIDCERWLRQRGILPNEGLRYFKRVGSADPYDPRTGLKFPPEGEDRRRMKAPRAIQKIKRLQQIAEANCCKA
jgi:hypothetical protein